MIDIQLDKQHRTIRSFVIREGRLTPGQKRALDSLFPLYGITLNDNTLNFAAIFDNPNPVVLEIGFGNGEALVQTAVEQPDYNFIGIEVHRPGVGHALQQIEAEKINNMRVICADAIAVLKNNIADSSLAKLNLFFPDPWPKKRHHKRRIVQTDFVKLVNQKLESDGILHMATDWAEYAEHMRETMGNSPNFKCLSDAEIAKITITKRPETKFEQRGKRLEHNICDLIYRKI